MAIKNRELYMKAAWNWHWLDDCFQHNIKVSDIDGMVERNGMLLFIEAKPAGKGLRPGQWRAFQALALRGCTVLVLWGENPEDPIVNEMMIWKPGQSHPEDKRLAKNADVIEFVSQWYVHADNHDALKSQ